MLTAIYCRVSTEKQAEKYGLDAQVSILTKYCKDNGWDYLIYNEGGVSGETLIDRPKILELLKDAKNGKFQQCLAIEMERYSRSERLSDWDTIKEAFRIGNVKFGTPNQLFDPADEEDDFLSDLYGALSKREKKKILKRMKRGKIEAAKKGKYLGGNNTALGYRYNKEKEQYEIDENERLIVELIFKLCIENNLSSREIAEKLNSLGTLTRKGANWRSGTICGIIRNTIYYGEYRRMQNTYKMIDGKQIAISNKEYIVVNVPSIISKERFYLAQERIKYRKIFSKSNTKNEYLLSGLIFCGKCGRKYNGYTVLDKNYNKLYHYYCCAGRTIKELKIDCNMPNFRIEIVDQAIWEKIRELIKEPKILRDAIGGEEKEKDSITETDIRHLDKLIEENKVEQNRILRLYRKGKITEQQLDDQLREIEKAYSILVLNKEQFKSQLTEKTQRANQLKNIEQRLRELNSKIDNYSFEEKRFLIRLICPGDNENRITILDNGEIEIKGLIDFEGANIAEDTRESYFLSCQSRAYP